jgi:hypothetical protein
LASALPGQPAPDCSFFDLAHLIARQFRKKADALRRRESASLGFTGPITRGFIGPGRFRVGAHDGRGDDFAEGKATTAGSASQK